MPGYIKAVYVSPHSLYDCVVNLLAGAPLLVTWLYSLSRPERAAWNIILRNHCWNYQPIHVTSQSWIFFFVEKKSTRLLDLAQTFEAWTTLWLKTNTQPTSQLSTNSHCSPAPNYQLGQHEWLSSWSESCKLAPCIMGAFPGLLTVW